MTKVIDRVGVVGCGLMGSGIAEVTARAGLDVVVCERDDHGTHLRRLEPAKLRSWLDKYMLGELWRMGEIGGNRW